VLSELSYTRDGDWISENNEPGCAEVGERHVQGVVNLADNRAEDGGFWLVPGFHKYLPQWTAENKKLGWMYGLDYTYVLFHPNDFPQLHATAQHISARAGSAILWDQRTAHGTLANRSLHPRFGQFVKMFPAESPAMTAGRAKARATAIRKKLHAVNIDPKTDLTELGKELFGLDS
jgi:ectoine hydroxylase-related dioxygenase (phytanoyl-CoA dioxygenase family)